MGPNPFFQNPAAQQQRLPQFQNMASYQNPFMQQAPQTQQAAAPTGANRPGFEYRQDRRQAKAAGTYDPTAQPEMGQAPTGANRAGYGYRQGRRQQKRADGYDPNAQMDDGNSLYEQQQGMPQQAMQQIPGMQHNYQQMQSALGQWGMGGGMPGATNPWWGQGGGWNGGMMQPMNFGGWRGY